MVNKPCQADKETKSKSPCKSDEKVVKQTHCDALEEMMCPKCFRSISAAFPGFGFFMNLSLQNLPKPYFLRS